MNTQQEDFTRQQQGIEGLFGQWPFGGQHGELDKAFAVTAKPVKSEIEVMRDKLVDRYNKLAKQEAKKMTWEEAARLRSQMIAVLQTQLETYGCTFGEK